ncbi:MAG: sigma-70 family RNA polymerase sigma factor [Bacteroidales bacterium]|nr:sigma-70 family RNA polymerase sigma factor [Bacteroidales bacterium]
MEQFKKMTEEELLAQCAAGREDYLNALIERYRSRVMAYIRMNVSDSAAADDIFQESFIRVLTSLRAKKYDEKGKFVSWVIRIAHNLIIDFYRSQKRVQLVHDSDVEYNLWARIENDENAESIESEMIHRQMLEDIGKMITRLPECQRKVLEMRHYADMSFKEIAEATDVSINTALGRMRYGILNLRRLMNVND